MSFVNSNNLTTIKRSVTDNEEPCFKQVEICIWQKDCEQTVSGDVVIHEECGPWYNTGDCSFETVPCNEEPQCPNGMSLADCACLLLQICNDDDECSNIPSVTDVLAGCETVSEEPTLIQEEQQNNASDSIKTYKYKTRFAKNSLGWYHVNFRRYDLFEKQKNANTTNWFWTRLEHTKIVKEGSPPPYFTIDVELIDVTNEISENGNNARLRIDYSVVVQVNCGPINQPGYFTSFHEINKYAN